MIRPVTAVGPILGGWITDNYSWRWVFYMNVPVGLLAVWLVQRFVFDPDYIRKARPGRIDGLGFGLLSLWLGTMQIVLDKGQDADWFGAVWIRWFALVSAVAFVAFLVREFRCDHPIADLRVFKNRNFTVSTALVSVSAVLIYGPMTLLPLFLQGLLGYSAMDSGLTQMSCGLGCFLGMPLAGALLAYFDPRKLIATGFLLLALSTLMFAGLSLEFARSYLDWPNFLQGIGISLSMVPLMTVAMALVPKEQIGNASGIFALARNLAGSIGISWVTTLVTRSAQFHQPTLVAHLAPYNPVYQQAIQAAQAALVPHVGAAQAPAMAEGLVYRSLLQQTNMLGYADAFYALALLCFIAIPFVLLLKRVVLRGPVVAH